MGKFGLVLDIDGCLYKDFRPIDGVIETLEMIVSKSIPFVLVTNGGFLTEEEKSKQLETLFMKIPLKPEQIVLSHSPFSIFSDEFKMQRCLVVGPFKSKGIEILSDYGFKNIYWIDDFIEDHQQLFPYKFRDHRNLTSESSSLSSISESILKEGCNCNTDRKIVNIIILRLPLDWLNTIQAVLDVLLSDGNVGHPSPQQQVVSIYFCNPDIIYGGAYKDPRLTEGAYREAVCTLYKILTYGKDLKYHCLGKPSQVTYDYVKHIFNEFYGIKHEDAYNFYAIGDNPASDIEGANAQGTQWTSILVKTGVFRDGQKHEAKFVFDNFNIAMEHIWKTEEL